ncbi:phosphate transport system permease protein [Advenella faeciporci]|uniref:Phosphate transport system permease protein n=2 Tax=Advenella faeciporci TaxID=797535 RepID=A0A918JNV7_9BURK|nr:phosphate transport system permease protein [Advenella faeciporci]
MVSLVYGSRETIAAYGMSFFTTNDWDPVNDVYGAVVPILGTVITAFIALLIAVPVSFGIAMFLTELAPAWLRRPLGVAVEMLAAIPSIIYGMWGLFVFVPIFQEYIQPGMIAVLGNIPVIGGFFSGPPFGIGLFTAGLILSIMIIPYIASVMRDVFEVVPTMLKESAYGLGASTWEVMWKVVLPYTRSGVIGGIMLGLGRALGETMAVTFVIGNAFRLPDSIFAPANSIASAIANEFNEAGGLQKSALIELGLILFLITTIVLALSRLLLARAARGEGKKS